MSVASSYAKALFGAATDLKLSAQDLDRIETELEGFDKSIAASREARIALLGPMVTAKEKTAAVSEIAKRAGYSRLTADFLGLLARKDRMNILGGVREAFREERLVAEGGIPGRLVSAEPMSQADIDDLAGAFTKKLGKRVKFDVSTDPALLAGVKVSVSGVTYDGSLRSELQRLKDRLTAGFAE